MTQYPDTETYLVSYCWGSCGSFISSLIYDFLFEYEPIIPFSEAGNSHNRAVSCSKNWSVRPTATLSKRLFLQGKGIYNFVSPLNPNKPLIMLDHNFPNFDELFSIYPKCKVIVISITPSDIPRVKGNLFYKVLEPDGILTEFNPNDKFRVADNFMNVNVTYSGEHSDNITVLPIYDIIHCKKKTLSLLSQITGKPITEKIVGIYDDYIAAQENLVRTKMPWVKV